MQISSTFKIIAVIAIISILIFLMVFILAKMEYSLATKDLVEATILDRVKTNCLKR